MNRNSPSPRSANTSPPGLTLTRSQAGLAHRGVALVITLIMLSIITVITVTILAIVRRDRASVTQQANLTDARLAADAAQERAKTEIMAQILGTTNLMGFELTVSRSIPLSANNPLVDPDPRVPVFVDTNRLGQNGPLDPRFFIDLNRNGLFEDSFIISNAPNAVTNFVGDPHWIGLLEKPYSKHGPNNRFTARYAFIVLPSGKSLDMNWIHNAASDRAPALKPAFSYFRNQGFGPWELNLAGFLADLSPPVWGGPANYGYDDIGGLTPLTGGFAFADAKDILAYRYGGNLNKLPSVLQLYGGSGVNAFTTDLIDGYAIAPGAMGLVYPITDTDNPNLPWSGADSLQHYFSHQDVFDGNKVGTNFTIRLRAISAITNAFDNYTFYKMLSQLGTDSAAADLEEKIHLNYTNAASPDRLANANFVAWDSAPGLSEQFLITVADALLHEQFREFNPGWNATPAYTNISSITNIPIAPTNFYTPAVHRLLQVAANIYDASRSNIYPSVFRPTFSTKTIGGLTNVFITGFVNDNQRVTLGNWLATARNYGIPPVIGAKKGFPNFNEYTLQTDIQVTRKLQFVRPDTNSPPSQTNQMYVLGISNLFAVEAWNSYQRPYPGSLQLEISDAATVWLTNQAGLQWTKPIQLIATSTNLLAGGWRGKQFILPIYVSTNLLPPSVYRFASKAFEPVNNKNTFEPGFQIPDWSLTVSNNFLYILTDNGRIIDLVFATEFTSAIDIDNTLMTTGQQLGVNGAMENPLVSRMWDTNRVNNSTSLMAPTLGIRNQIAVCLGTMTVGDDVWRAYLDDAARGQDKNKSIRACQQFFQMGSTQYPTEPVIMDSLVFQSPFCPTRKLVRTVTWQADDPLVHYHYGDLLMETNSLNEFIVPPTAQVPTNMTLASLGQINKRYSPWGGNPELNSGPLDSADPDAFTMAIKDPGVRSSDDWEFPAGKFPTVGWLGRVHRGTPWQTIYFKSTPAEASEDQWRKQSAEYRWAPAYWFRSHPTNDWILADLFTTATDANSTRGLLSVSQSELPAWSAVLAGVVVLRNRLSDAALMTSVSTNAPIPMVPEFIVPAANDTNMPPLLDQFVSGLNNFRRTMPAGGFETLSEFLRVPELTWRSPWLNTASEFQLKMGLTDAAYERLPQQILSLVKVGDARFVIYAYGQSLRPAPDSIDSSQGNICTNYQVTAEVATRAVIRVEGGPESPRPVIETFNVLPPD